MYDLKFIFLQIFCNKKIIPYPCQHYQDFQVPVQSKLHSKNKFNKVLLFIFKYKKLNNQDGN